jgi:hypothetical protein
MIRRRAEPPAAVFRCWMRSGAVGLRPAVPGLLSCAVARPAARQMSFADLELLRQGARLEPLLQAICDFLDKQPALVERVRRDLVRGLKQPDHGRRGLTAPQVLRALVLMRVKNWDYRELRVHLIQPTRKEMRKRLAKVAAATEVLIAALNHNATREFLDAADTEAGAEYDTIALSDLKNRAVNSLKLSSLATPRGRTRSGRGKALLPGSFSPKVFCAAIVAEAWNVVRDGYPAPSNLAAAALANLFWEVSGGPVTGGWGDHPLQAWRPSFIEASESDVNEIKGKIRHYLMNARHFETICK